MVVYDCSLVGRVWVVLGALVNGRVSGSACGACERSLCQALVAPDVAMVMLLRSVEARGAQNS